MLKIIALPVLTIFLAIYLYPTSVVKVIQFDEIPSDPHYDYYLILYPGESLQGLVSVIPATPIGYVEIRGPVYDQWEPRILSKAAFANCTFKPEAITCYGSPMSSIESAYIQAAPKERFNLNSSDILHLARAYEEKDSSKAIELYRLIGGFFASYRIAVLKMDMDLFLQVYYQYPHRKEPLYYLARHYRTHGKYSKCLLYARTGMLVGSPVAEDIYIEKPIYRYALELELAHCLYHSGRPKEAINQWKRVLPNLPSGQLKKEIIAKTEEG